jgi:hypothetical protein
VIADGLTTTSRRRPDVDDRHAEQRPTDVAVVTTTILRPSLLRAARSVFRQAQVGRIHLLIGVGVAQGDTAVLDTL